MPLAYLLALQAATATAPDPIGVVPSDFDLARLPGRHERPDLTFSRGCRRDDPDEILVCGVRREGGDFPMEEMERLFAARRLVAETSLGGDATGRLYVDQQVLDRGAVSNRVMVGIKLPF